MTCCWEEGGGYGVNTTAVAIVTIVAYSLSVSYSSVPLPTSDKTTLRGGGQ